MRLSAGDGDDGRRRRRRRRGGGRAPDADAVPRRHGPAEALADVGAQAGDEGAAGAAAVGSVAAFLVGRLPPELLQFLLVLRVAVVVVDAQGTAPRRRWSGAW